jgi:serine/threonine-protein kinase HipA
MSKVSVLDVLLYGEPIGALTNVGGDRTLFAFTDGYIKDEMRSTLGLGFKDEFGGLITEFRPYQTRTMPFFSNLLPEGHLRSYLAEKAQVNPEREFFLLWALGRDLPGAITIRPADGEAWPPNASDEESEELQEQKPLENVLRFSLAGVQLKFSAVQEASGGLTIPASGVGGSWIVKLPSREFEAVPENEFSMMVLAQKVGMDVPHVDLIDVAAIKNLPEGIEAIGKHAFIIERFDRLSDGSAIHIEDFAQVFGVYPDKKYKTAKLTNIAQVLAAEGSDDDVSEFVRRMVFNALIGNGDMHLKNWSLIYRDRRRASLAPAYDFVSTIPYIPNETMALNVSRTKSFAAFDADELSHFAASAAIPEKVAFDVAKETVARFHEVWASEKANLPMSKEVRQSIDRHLKALPLAKML